MQTNTPERALEATLFEVSITTSNAVENHAHSLSIDFGDEVQRTRCALHAIARYAAAWQISGGKPLAFAGLEAVRSLKNVPDDWQIDDTLPGSVVDEVDTFGLEVVRNHNALLRNVPRPLVVAERQVAVRGLQHERANAKDRAAQQLCDDASAWMEGRLIPDGPALAEAGEATPGELVVVSIRSAA